MTTEPEKKADVTTIVLIQGALLLIAYLGIKYSGLEIGEAKDATGLYVVAGLGAGVVTYAIAMLIFRLVHSRSQKLRDLVANIRSSVSHFGLTAIVIVSMSAAIGEEMFFRVFLQGWASQYVPVWLAVIAASVLFAAAHGVFIVYFLIALALGLAIGAAFALTDSIVMAIAWHFSYDLISFLVIVKYPQLLLLSPDNAEDS